MFFNIFGQKSNKNKIINKSGVFFHLNSLCTEYPRESLPAHSTLKDFSTGWWIMRDALASECIINVNPRFSARIKDLFPVRWQLEERSGKQSVHHARTYAVRFTGIADSTFWRAVKRVREWLMLLLHRQSLLGLRWVKVRGGGSFLLVAPPSGQERLSHSSWLSDSTVPKFCSGLLSCFYNAVLDKGEGRFSQLIRDFQEFFLSSFLD